MENEIVFIIVCSERVNIKWSNLRASTYLGLVFLSPNGISRVIIILITDFNIEF